MAARLRFGMMLMAAGMAACGGSKAEPAAPVAASPAPAASAVAAPPIDATAPTLGPATMPAACREYLAAMRAFLACDQVAAALRASMRQGMDATAEAFSRADLAPDAHAMLSAACTQGSDALRQAASSLDCTI